VEKHFTNEVFWPEFEVVNEVERRLMVRAALCRI